MLCDMPSEKAFLEATTVRMGGKLGFKSLGPVLTRDRLVGVDDALEAWWKVPITDINAKRVVSLTLLKACAEWSKKHQGNTSATRTGAQRLIAIENVVRQSKICLVSLAPTTNHAPKGLMPSYQAERADYKNNKNIGIKKNPVGGTYVHGIQDDVRNGYTAQIASVQAILDKHMSQMTDQDFIEISKAFSPNNVKATQTKYLNKSERLDHLITVNNGILCNKDGTPINESMAYAMDKYGMLYGKSMNNLRDTNIAGFFNHSSFLAGKDVICAGEIIHNLDQFYANQKGIDTRYIGKTVINTSSGHYQPDGENLKNCIRSLVYSGLNATIHVAGSPESNPAVPYQLASDLIA